jgi:hypothetical protein
MTIGILDYGLWGAATILEFFCCLLAWRRGLHRRLPLFTLYLFLVFAADLSAWWLWHSLGYETPLTFYIHWSFEAILLAARALAIAELCWDTLSMFSGIWRLSRIVLVAVAVLLTGVATGNAWGEREALPAFIYTAQHGLEIAALAIILVLLAICRYYRVPVRPVTMWLAFGLGLYAGVQIALLGLVKIWGNQYIQIFSTVRAGSYAIALGIWFAALWRASNQRVTGTALLPAEVYEQVAPQVNAALEKLNSRLLEILRG